MLGWQLHCHPNMLFLGISWLPIVHSLGLQPLEMRFQAAAEILPTLQLRVAPGHFGQRACTREGHILELGAVRNELAPKRARGAENVLDLVGRKIFGHGLEFIDLFQGDISAGLNRLALYGLGIVEVAVGRGGITTS
jgi:hypothetical protein